MKGFLLAAILSASTANAASHECIHKLTRDGAEIWQCGHEGTASIANAAVHHEPPPHEPPPHEPPPDHKQGCGDGGRHGHKHHKGD